MNTYNRRSPSVAVKKEKMLRHKSARRADKQYRKRGYRHVRLMHYPGLSGREICQMCDPLDLAWDGFYRPWIIVYKNWYSKVTTWRKVQHIILEDSIDTIN